MGGEHVKPSTGLIATLDGLQIGTPRSRPKFRKIYRLLLDPLRRVRESAGQHVGQILSEDLRGPCILRNAERGIVQGVSRLVV